MKRSVAKKTVESLQANDWREKARLFIAVNIQRLFRGIVARRKVAEEIWRRYWSAAVKIQRGYRRWKCKTSVSRITLEAFRARSKVMESFSKRRKEEVVDMETILRDKATNQQKIALWRLIIELRKAHSNCTTDILLKALIETKCDLPRAIVLIGNQEFSLRNDSELPKNVRKLFLPTQVAAKARKKAPRSDSLFDANGNFIGHSGEVRGVDVIRALRQRHEERQIYVGKNAEISNMLSDILYKSYFSIYHVGSAVGLKKYDKISK